MSRTADLSAALALTRPRQWPILTAQLAVGVLLSAPAGGVPRPPAHPWVLVAAWAAWVVLLNGATLAYNSAWDRDTGPVAYLQRPPTPPSGLAGWSLAAMLAGAALGFLVVGPVFGAVTTSCVALSVLYSHPGARWKSRPGLDLAVNMVGYGAGTTLAGLAAGSAAGLGRPDALTTGFLAAGFACLFGSFYPLTQIYQADADRDRGDRTLATALGTVRSLDLALVLGVLAAVPLLGGVAWAAGARALVLPALALLSWSGLLVWWRRRATVWQAADHEAGMYRALLLWALVDAALVAAWWA